MKNREDRRKMQQIHFTKMQGTGNDFIVLDCIAHPEYLKFACIPKVASNLCDRHYGIGADGLVLVLPSDLADIRMRIINSDGSEAEMCGNGIRCFARFVYEMHIVSKAEMTVETGAGILVPRILQNDAGDVIGVMVDMGEPILERAGVPMLGAGQAIDVPIQVEEQEFLVTAIGMGNPHCVTFVENLSQFPITYWGPRMEADRHFPRKTNVEYVQVLNEAEVRMRVWERGAAVTMACGTGSCATVAACVLNGKTGRDVLVHLDGGDLRIFWDEVSNHLFMTGPAETVFTGIYLQEVTDNE